MRRPITKKHEVRPDLKYNSLKVAKFINYIMLNGKRNAARDIVYGAFEELEKQEGSKGALEIFEEALLNIEPTMEVRSRRIGGANYQVPRPVNAERRRMLSMTWLIGVARGRKGKPMHKILAEEILLAAKGEGEAVKKRENTHRMAEANKAFAHFSW